VFKHYSTPDWGVNVNWCKGILHANGMNALVYFCSFLLFEALIYE